MQINVYKKLFYTVCILIGAGLASCSKILEQEPRNSTYFEQYWKTVRDCESALAGNYALLRNVLAGNDRYYLYGDAIAKHYFVIDYNGDGLEGIQNGDFTFTYNLTYGNWTNFFKVIAMSNLIMKQVPLIPDANLEKDAADVSKYKRQVIGQALYIRALCYFMMTRIWGDVPMVTESYDNPLEAPQLARTSKTAVMKQVEDDCHAAMGMLDWGYGTNTDKMAVTANRGSVYALLAHLYMWRATAAHAGEGGAVNLSDVNSADTTITTLLARGGYALTDTVNYYKTFIGKSKEGIFEINMSENQLEGSGSHIGVSFLRGSEYVAYFGDYARMAVKPEYLSLHFGPASNDVRYRKAFDYLNDPRPLCRKYSNVVYRNPGLQRDAFLSNNMIIFRLSDLMLLQAEAAIYKSEFTRALDIINFFRERNGSDPLPAQATMEDYLYEYVLERGRELYLEGHLFYDLLRTRMYPYFVDWLGEGRYLKEGFYWPVDPALFRNNKFLKQTTYWVGKI
jgi:hypothetical protein